MFRRRVSVIWLLLAAAAALAAGVLGALVVVRPAALFPPTSTPSATPIPTLTPSATPTITPSPTPTPIPPARVAAGDEAMLAGDWPRAISAYQAVLAESQAADLRAAAQLGLVKARLSAGDLAGAVAEAETFQTEFPASAQIPDAHFLTGEAQFAAGQWRAAAASYQAYLSLRPGVIDSYVYQRLGQADYQAGEYAAARDAYQAAVNAPRADAGETFDLREGLALAHLALGDSASALAEYEAAATQTDQDWRKAHLAALAGQLLYNLGRLDEAYARYQAIVNHYPQTADAFQALVTLVNDGQPVDEYQRGLVNYSADNYESALSAFDRYLAGQPAAPGAALYYRALTLAALQRETEALAGLRRLVDTYPNDAYWAKAYLQIAFIQAYPHDVQTFRDFVAAAPQAPEAPDALYRAARLCERNDDLTSAVQLWSQLADSYPTSNLAADAAVQAGVALFRQEQYGRASQSFERAASLTSDPGQQARAWLWLGKAQNRLGDARAAEADWSQAAGLDPHGYYSLRAGQLLIGRAPFAPPADYNFAFDAAREQAEAEVWLRGVFPDLPPDQAVSELQPGLWREARFVRGGELWRLGRFTQAHAEFDSLRLSMQGDPLAMWQLALYFHNLGAYDLAIRSARTVVDLAGYADTLLAPRFILRLRYPAPFESQTRAAAQAYGLHPFFLYAKMRLESFFWKYAFSSAEARGLNQIIPATADDIAQRLGLADFSYDDLYRPQVSLPMGAFYLNFVGQYVDDNPTAILAGYYAGPGNARAWLDLAQGDPDLLVEVIRLPDARGYVQTAFAYFETYRTLYAAP